MVITTDEDKRTISPQICLFGNWWINDSGWAQLDDNHTDIVFAFPVMNRLNHHLLRYLSWGDALAHLSRNEIHCVLWGETTVQSITGHHDEAVLGPNLKGQDLWGGYDTCAQGQVRCRLGPQRCQQHLSRD